MNASGEWERKAPYAPISALREFFEKIRNVAVPPRVDKRFVEKLRVASNNEWALLSALKFLGVVDEQGVPTHAYRLLQTTDRFEDTLRHLVLTAYAPVFESGGTGMSTDELTDFFRYASSPSQAKNAARFFREVCRLAGIQGPSDVADREPVREERAEESISRPGAAASAGDVTDVLLLARAGLLEKLPAPNAAWTAQEYLAICDRFLEMLRLLER